MICLHIFTEEPSLKIVFDAILPKILPKNVAFRIYPHQGKHDLLMAVEKAVPSISKIPGSKILITKDQDNDDCLEAKMKLVKILQERCHCDFLVRIVCTELESWFLGDMNAIKKVYPRFNEKQYQHKAKFKNVDKISYPSKVLLKILPDYSNRLFLPKIEVSEKIAQHLNVEVNKSKSFQNTIAGIYKLIG